jgi:hypothetical protein
MWTVLKAKSLAPLSSIREGRDKSFQSQPGPGPYILWRKRTRSLSEPFESHGRSPELSAKIGLKLGGDSRASN